MAISYKRAPEVNPDDPITSGQWNDLAKAFNDRLENGVADPSWRLFWYADALFQYMRQGDGSQIPARDEWWSHWSHIEPVNGKNWPQTDPGTVGGINPSNPIAAFVYGNEGLDIFNETDRLNYDPADGSGILMHDLITGSPTSDLDHWEIAKVQRGVTDSTGSEIGAANALIAADRYYRINYGSAHSYLKTYGGFFASPQVVGKCNDPAFDEYIVKFRKIDPQTDCTYTTCPDGSGSGSCPGTSKPVLGWFAGVYGYVLYHFDDTTTILPYTNYVEGPYTGNAFLRHERGGQLDFALDVYAAEFRGADYGSATQRNEKTWNPQDHAFHFEEFFTRQYYLAPARGSATGYGGALVAEYPQFDFASGTAINSLGIVNSSTSYTINSAFAFAGFIVVGTNLQTPKKFAVYVDGTRVKEITVEAGAATDISHYFPNVFKAGSVVQISTLDSMGAGESAYVEIAEILDMTPRVQDAYLVLRMSSARNQTMDGWGHEEADARELWENYQRYGMAVNHVRDGIKDQDPQGIWKNPVYEEVRRITHERLRLVKRNHLVGYEINSSGNSVLHFTRFPGFLGGGNDEDIDLFKGMAPQKDAIDSGYVKPGVTYKVTGSGAVINYAGANFSENQTFKGIYKQNNWTILAGTPVIYEHDLIIAQAPEQGETNQWQMFMQTLPYKPSDSSVYKPEVFADRDGMFVDRCTLLSDSWGEATDQAKEIRAHVYSRQPKPINRQENPSGYRYVLGTNEPEKGNSTNLVGAQNTIDCLSLEDETNCAGQVAHYGSCKIYVPDYKIESITYNRTSGHVEVEINGRLYHNDNVANQAVANNATSWSAYMTADDTGAAAARSDENAVIEYLRYITSGTQCVIRIGDQSGDANTTSGWYATQYNGACFPRFHFVKQMPYVFEDSNNFVNEHDTRLTVDNMLWSGFVLRAICEGYLDYESDSNTSQTLDAPCQRYHCGHNRMFDYRYATLMTQAMDNRWFSAHPEVSEGDNWEGYGPFPQMKAYALHFNQISKAINLLTRARIELPTYGVRWREKTYEAFVPLDNSSCDYRLNISIPDQVSWTLTNTGSYNYDVPTGVCSDSVILQARKRALLDVVNGVCGIDLLRTDVEFDLAFGVSGVETMAYYALPERLRDMLVVSAGSFGNLANENRIFGTTSATLFGGPGSPDPCNYTIDSNVYEFPQSDATYDECKTVLSGILEAEKPRPSDYINTGSGCNRGSDMERNYAFSATRSFINVPLS